MSTSTIQNSAGSAKRVYQAIKKLVRQVENDELTFYKMCSDFEEVPAEGEEGGVRFPIFVSPEKNISGSNFGATTVRAVDQRTEVQGAVAPVEVTANFDIADMLTKTGNERGAFVPELVRTTTTQTQQLAKMIQRYACSSHGTGRLGVVQDATVGVTTFVLSKAAATCYGDAVLMVNDYIDIYDLDSSGSAAYSNVKVTKIDHATRTVTTNTTMTLTAGYSIYRADMYGLAINGLRNLVDNGDYALTIHGLTRSDNPTALNSVKKSIYSGSNPQDLTQQPIDDAMDLCLSYGAKIDTLMGSPGVVQAFNRINVTLRQVTIPTGQGPLKQQLGRKGNGTYEYRGNMCQLVLDVNALPRTLYGFESGVFRKYIVSDIEWMSRDGSMYQRGIGSTGMSKTSWTGVAVWQGNFGIQRPNNVFLIEGAKDTFHGDTV